MNSHSFHRCGICSPRTLAASTQSVLHSCTPQLILWYDSSHYHGSIFLRQLERSAEWSKSALTDRSPKKTSSLDVHQQERSNQADATSMDGALTVYCHTHSIITSSNARVVQAVQNHESKGLLSGVAYIIIFFLFFQNVVGQNTRQCE